MINAHSDVTDSKADFEVQCLHTKQAVSRTRLRSHCSVYYVSGQTLTSENEGYTWTVNLETAKKIILSKNLRSSS